MSNEEKLIKILIVGVVICFALVIVCLLGAFFAESFWQSLLCTIGTVVFFGSTIFVFGELFDKLEN